MTRDEITRFVQWCRSEFRNDGAEGESVHALCDYIESIHAKQDAIRGAFTIEPCEAHGERYCDCDK